MTTPEADLCNRYLTLLGVQWGKADLGTLEEIVGSQLTHVPFENISKLYHKRRTGLHGLIGFEEHLDGIQHHNFGGTCYANNYYLYRLLVNLGYDARLCGADMSNPDVHIVTMVRIDEREFLVDAGYGAPFLRPLPRDAADDVVISLGNERYVLKPREPDGCSRLQMFRDGVLKHGYRAKPAPRQIAGFDSVIKQSFDPTATFMNAVVLIRFEPGRSYVIRNLTFTESHNTYTYTQNLANREELTTCIGDVFGISRSVVCEALAQVPCFNDVWD